MRMKKCIMLFILLLAGCNPKGNPRIARIEDKIFVPSVSGIIGGAHFVMFAQKLVKIKNDYGERTIWLPQDQWDWDTLKVGQMITLNYPITMYSE